MSRTKLMCSEPKTVSYVEPEAPPVLHSGEVSDIEIWSAISMIQIFGEQSQGSDSNWQLFY